MLFMREYSLQENGIIKSIAISSTMRRRDRRTRYQDHDLEPIDFYPRCVDPTRSNIDGNLPSHNRRSCNCKCGCILSALITVFLAFFSIYFVMTKYKIILIQSNDDYHNESHLQKQALDIITYAELEKRISDLKQEMEAMRRELTGTIDTLAKNISQPAMENPNATQSNETSVTPIEDMIQNALIVYDADKIGLFDYAAEYAGGVIVSTPETLPYPLNHSVEVFGVFRVRIWSKPDYILQPDPLPGECFVFHGREGKMVIQLGEEIMITSVTLEHIPPMLVKDNSCAPRDFDVLGMQDEYDEGELLGHFTYEVEGKPVQTFETKKKPVKYAMVMLHILNNYGNLQFTCVYRFRVHSS